MSRTRRTSTSHPAVNANAGAAGSTDELTELLEADWQRGVIELARSLGYRVAHFRPALTKHGWRTAVAADGEGYVDLTLVSARRRRVVFVELKRDHGKVSPAQAQWLADLHYAGAEVYLARPRNLDALARVLSSPTSMPGYLEARGALLLELDPVLREAA